MKAVLVGGTKGGIGKTTVAADLARRLAQKVPPIGFLDADLDNPSAARALGLPPNARITFDRDATYAPWDQDGVRVFSQSLVGPKVKALTWVGEQHRGLIADAVRHTRWGDARLLVVDLPAGSGDEVLAAVEALTAKECAMVLVTIPRHLDAAERAVQLAMHLEVPVLGVIENLAGFACSHGEITFPFGQPRARAFCDNYGIPWLGLLPVDVSISEANAAGRPLPDVLAVPVVHAVEAVLKWA